MKLLTLSTVITTNVRVICVQGEEQEDGGCMAWRSVILPLLLLVLVASSNAGGERRELLVSGAFLSLIKS